MPTFSGRPSPVTVADERFSRPARTQYTAQRQIVQWIPEVALPNFQPGANRCGYGSVNAEYDFILAGQRNYVHYYTMKKTIFCAALASATVICGCVSFFDNPFFTVKESGLNWVFIRNYNLRASPIHRVSVRVDGNGLVTVRDGTSVLVTNPFAASHTDASWNDLREQRITIPREDVMPLFQMLVDAGLFKERRKGDSANTNEAIFVSANIQGKTCGSEDDIYGSDPELAEHLKNVVMMFYRPQPRKR